MHCLSSSVFEDSCGTVTEGGGAKARSSVCEAKFNLWAKTIYKLFPLKPIGKDIANPVSDIFSLTYVVMMNVREVILMKWPVKT